jgi:hypothetical protein
VDEFAEEGDGGGVPGLGGLALALEEADGPLAAVSLDVGVPLLLVLAPADAEVLGGAALLRALVAGEGIKKLACGPFWGPDQAPILSYFWPSQGRCWRH